MWKGLKAMVVVALLGMTSSADAYVLNVHEGNVVRWHAQQIELHVMVNVRGQLHGVSLRRALTQAVDAWQRVAVLPEVKIIPQGRELPTGYDPNARENYNTVQVLSDWPFDPDNLAVTVTSLAPDGAILDADVFINAGAFDFTDAMHPHTPDGYYDLPSVLTHELGHVFGLDEAVDVPEATMWPNIHPKEMRARTLHDDDVAGVTEAYSMPEPRLASSSSPSDPASAPSSGQASGKPRTAGVGATGCAAAPASNAAGATWLWLVFFGLLWRARRAILLVALMAAGCGHAEPQRSETEAMQAATASEVRDGWIQGRVASRRTVRRQGILFTRLHIVSEDGRNLTTEVVGGELDGVTQHAFHQAVPKEGEAVIAKVHKGQVRGFRATDDRPVTGRAVSSGMRHARERSE